MRLWFCVAVAMIAAAIADPLIESASNAGLFGPHTFTDHSTADVIPALLVGMILTVCYFFMRLRRILVANDQRKWLRQTSDALGPEVLRLVPLMFVVQIFALYLMESSEQLFVYGHALGGSIWLGAPIAASLFAHGLTCAIIAVAAMRVLRALTEATLHLAWLVRVLATLRAGDGQAALLVRANLVPSNLPLRVLCRIGERGPPILIA